MAVIRSPIGEMLFTEFAAIGVCVDGNALRRPLYQVATAVCAYIPVTLATHPAGR